MSSTCKYCRYQILTNCLLVQTRCSSYNCYFGGKRDENLVLPANSSVSVTLDLNELCAKTTIAFSTEFKRDRIWLNSNSKLSFDACINDNVSDANRILGFIKGAMKLTDEGRINKQCTCAKYSHRKPVRRQSPLRQRDAVKVHICSENNFPTAAGLASSAAGFCCLVYALAKGFEVSGELSAIMRLGSGSACRSAHGGFVVWDRGCLDDGSDCVTRQIAPAEHWPVLRALLLVVSESDKIMPSSAGMHATMLTSSLMRQRLLDMPQRTQMMITAIRECNFSHFAKLTMQESNQLHSVCLDTFPPLFYLTDTSKRIMEMVHAYNAFCNQTKVAYTFDAGPNACLYLLEEDVDSVVGLLISIFCPLVEMSSTFLRGLPISACLQHEADISKICRPLCPGGIKYIIHTKVGNGPEDLKLNESLLGEDGFPTHIA